jgi:mannose-1-phosphate guanylyltransferase
MRTAKLSKQSSDEHRSIIYFPDQTANLCGLVLAGGEGQRLRPLVERLRGDALPKQYVNFSGSCSMLEHTFRRAEKLIPRERVFTIINKEHLNFPEVDLQLSKRCPGTVIVQPANRETGPGLLLPLTYIHKSYPNAVVAVFPSDQFVLEADRLMKHMRLAYAVVRQYPHNLVLLGVAPDYEEADYGYIIPSPERDITGWGTKPVQAFVEKPNVLQAQELIGQGALWNTMLMVFYTGTLFRLVNELEPQVYHYFESIYDAIGTPAEADVIQAAYGELRTVNFSKELLEPMTQKYPGRLVALPVTDVTWSDWGTESRIVSSLESISKLSRHFRPLPAVTRSMGVRSKRRGAALNLTL